MTKKQKSLLFLAIIAGFCGTINADPPLPLHTIEGNSGVCLSGTANIANIAEEGSIIAFLSERPEFSNEVRVLRVG